MERSHILEREQWKKDMEESIEQTKIQMIQLTEDQLDATTKKTMAANEQMSNELSYQSREMEKLLHRNEILRESNARMKTQIEASKQIQYKLSERNLTYQKTIQAIVSFCFSVEAERLFQLKKMQNTMSGSTDYDLLDALSAGHSESSSQ